MYNFYIDKRSALDIDSFVERVLQDLGNPEPPIDLDMVRELLKLDRAFYSSSDTSILEETVHKLRIGVRQIVMRPRLLLEVVQRLELRALFLPDRKRILLDADLPKPKQRWGEAHEIGHSLIPWHQEVMLGDRKRTLSVACHQEIEAEANFAAGRLLFLREAFTERLDSGMLSFARLQELSREFKNTVTSTLWRAVESASTPIFGMMSQHPRRYDPQKPRVRYFLRSRDFAERFSGIGPMGIFGILGHFCFGSRGPIGSDEVAIPDVNGDMHAFLLECFNNGHEVLTLGAYRGPESSVVVVP